MTAPERIWAWVWNYPISKHHGSKVWVDFKPFWKKPITTFVSTSKWNPFVGRMEVCEQEVTEYVHIDLHDATKAQLAKAVELLKEARQDLEEYVTHEWPKDEHPVYERKWERDMELCRRIDAVLAEIEKGGV
jgi:hypothetical protein